MAKAKSTSSAIPSHNELKKPLIAFLRCQQEVSLVDAVAHVAKLFRIPQAAQQIMQGCGKETVLQNRVRWARWELKRDGKIVTTRRGFFRLA